MHIAWLCSDCSGIAEMLLQSHLSELHLLPALPDAWDTGSVTGLKGRGNFKVDLVWTDHRLKAANIRSESGEKLVLRTAESVEVEGLSVNSNKEGNYFITRFNTQAGETYKIIPIAE